MRQKFFVPCKQPCLAQSTIAQISKAWKYLTAVVIRLRENNRAMPPSIHVATLSGATDRNETALVASKPLTLFIEYCLRLFLQQFFGSFIDGVSAVGEDLTSGQRELRKASLCK